MPREYKRVLAAEAKKRASVEVVSVPAGAVAGGKQGTSSGKGKKGAAARQPQA